ncbi:MAG: hypothetical protein M1826_005799 [Phylliscum demangeonii]|nr:MAG: hypothetical protein M1826_005799 [Phylliscum demangeonii]
MSHPTEPPDIGWTLRRIFGKADFRPMQREIILAALDKHDVYLQAATSFGKSLCFQLPAVMDHGITIVVSPLLALMTNQVSALRAAGIAAATINSTTPASERQRILADLGCGHPTTRLLYVTPEYCATASFRRQLQTVHRQRELARIAIDEAHCISEWGHDFRPSFQQLSFFKRQFGDVPMMCVTATATARVRRDIIRTLGLKSSEEESAAAPLRAFIMPTARPNIHYEVRFKAGRREDANDPGDDFVRWLRAVHARRRGDHGGPGPRRARAQQLAAQGARPDAVCGIIYAWFRRECDAVAGRLCALGIGAKPYHAGLSAAERADHLAGWLADRVGYDVMVATTAFGMGIDKANVRYVMHWQIPKSFEGFYQEAGRAGRDGRAAVHRLYYSREDGARARSRLAAAASEEAESVMPDSASQRDHVLARARSLDALVDYCENAEECRHELIARYFALGDEDVGVGAGLQPPPPPSLPVCNYACDWHKDPKALQCAKRRFLKEEDLGEA